MAKKKTQTLNEFRPDWKLTPEEALSITLNLSLNKHMPRWRGCTDEQLLAVARDVIEHIKNEKLDR